MKSQTKILAEVLAERTFYDLDEMSNIIETYFKIWQSEQLNSELNSNDIVKRRNYLLSQKASRKCNAMLLKSNFNWKRQT